jgi:NAD(P) transhydrogenase subunit alpha
MKIGIPRETTHGERRVAASPESVKKLLKLGFSVVVERDAGLAAGFDNASYEAAGAAIAEVDAVWACEIVAKIRPPADSEAARLRAGQTLISFLYPAFNEALVAKLADLKVNALAMDQVPRTTRAQKVDALSSMGNLSGYRAVIEAVNVMQRPFRGQSTAAGKIHPAKVLVIGAGVAGLAAIGAARNLGAIVRAFDTRPAVKDQVTSMGAEFLEIKLAEDGTGSGGYAKEMSPEFIAAEMELFAAQAKDVDVIVTTALIPGKRAPILITADMVAMMKRGSVIVDLAAEQQGNCELTKPGEAVEVNGVTIVGYTDLPSRMAHQASSLYATNIVHLVAEMGGAEQFAVSVTNDIVRPMTVLKGGTLLWPHEPVGTPEKVTPHAPKTQIFSEEKGPPVFEKMTAFSRRSLILFALSLLGVGLVAPTDFLTHFTVFVLACFIGYHVVWSVTPALHTPLMSVTNAISGIILIGGLLQLGGGGTARLLAIAAIVLATINVAGGFLVTQRMLRMFRK